MVVNVDGWKKNADGSWESEAGTLIGMRDGEIRLDLDEELNSDELSQVIPIAIAKDLLSQWEGVGPPFLIGQRVIVGDEIGIVQRGPSMVKGPPGHDTRPRAGYVWVHLPSKGYASDFSVDNVRPLPGGQV